MMVDKHEYDEKSKDKNEILGQSYLKWGFYAHALLYTCLELNCEIRYEKEQKLYYKDS
jgi:hypothetical protein